MNRILAEGRKFFRYLLGKKEELKSMDARDLLLAKVILDIHRKRSGTVFTLVPLYQIHPIHPIDREGSMATVEKRVLALRNCFDELSRTRKITRAVLAERIPSVSWIKVVRQDHGSFIAYEGNGRLAALKKVFSPEDGIEVEVEEYLFRDYKKILRRMNRVRRLNGMISED